MIQGRSFWAEKGMEWRAKPCRYLGWESSRWGEAKVWGDTPGRSRDCCWGQWWKEGREEVRADLRRRQAATWGASSFYSSWKQSHYRVLCRELTWRNSHLETITLNAVLEILLETKMQAERPVRKPLFTIQARDDGGLGCGSGMIRVKILLNVVGWADRMCWRTEHGYEAFPRHPEKKEIKEQQLKQNKTTHSPWQIIQRFSTSAEATVKTHPSSTKYAGGAGLWAGVKNSLLDILRYLGALT